MQPNIVYIHSHDTGRYIQPYGHAVPTPHLQRLAEEGVLFRRAFCAAPTCSPSRAALLTGQCAHSSGMLGLTHRAFALHDNRQHLVHTLRAAGYQSVLAGIQHVARDTAAIGYDTVLPSSAERKGAEGAVAFLNSAPAQPFFLDVGFAQTHRGFPEPGPQEDERYCLPPASLPDTPETRRDMAAYKASARILDDQIGQVLAALDTTGLRDNTLVIYTTDHGIAFPAMKSHLTDYGIGVALLMRGPRHLTDTFAPGSVCDAMVSHIDIFPTLCDIASAPHPAWLQGASLLPLLRGEKAQIHDAVFAEVTFHASFQPMRAVRTERWKYIRQYGGRGRPVPVNTDDGPSRKLWLESGWLDQAVAPEQLYDLMFDPNEMANRAGDAALAPVLADMRARLDQWMHETNDPLLLDELPIPDDAIMHHPDALTAHEPPEPDVRAVVEAELAAGRRALPP